MSFQKILEAQNADVKKADIFMCLDTFIGNNNPPPFLRSIWLVQNFILKEIVYLGYFIS
jgi:hypothetical protein